MWSFPITFVNQLEKRGKQGLKIFFKIVPCFIGKTPPNQHLFRDNLRNNFDVGNKW